MKNCAQCGEQITTAYYKVHQERAKRQSTGIHTRDYCTDCAAAIHGSRGSMRNAATYVEPRYCTCTGTITRTPGLREQCDDCYRRIDPDRPTERNLR